MAKLHVTRIKDFDREIWYDYDMEIPDSCISEDSNGFLEIDLTEFKGYPNSNIWRGNAIGHDNLTLEYKGKVYNGLTNPIGDWYECHSATFDSSDSPFRRIANIKF
jgi:hypothetical protein